MEKSDKTNKSDKNRKLDPTAQEKLEAHRAKRRAQAARRRERAKKEKEEAEARARQEEHKKALDSRATSADAELAMFVDDGPNASGAEAHERSVTGSVSGETRSFWAATVNDTSEYNTEYEDAGVEGERDLGGDSELGIDEELAKLS